MRRDAKEAGFYFTIYPAAGSRPDVVIQLVQNGKVATEMRMEVATDAAAGRIQQLGRLPIDQLAPGIYELRAIVTQGDERVLRSTMVTVE